MDIVRLLNVTVRSHWHVRSGTKLARLCLQHKERHLNRSGSCDAPKYFHHVPFLAYATRVMVLETR